MNIYLGNLNVQQMQLRMGVNFPDCLIAYLQGKQQEFAGALEKDKWHCFDMPFVLKCENMAMAQVIYDFLSPLADDIKCHFEIALQE